MNYYHRSLAYSLASLTLSIVAGCSGSRPPITDAPATIRSRPETSARTQVEPSLTGPQVDERVAPVDPLAGVLIQVRELSERGDRSSRSGNIDDARLSFEGALDILWDYSRSNSSNVQIDREIDSLIARLQILGTDVRIPAAAIDAVARLDISPESLDPTLRERAKADIETPRFGLPIQLEDRVLAFLEYYTNGRGRRAIQAGLERAGLYAPMIRRILGEEGLPEDLIYLAQAESAFQPQALSRAAAKGLWQFIPARGREYGLRQTPWIDERSDPEKSTRAAARHLKDLYAEFGDWYLAMAAYNAGPARVRGALERAESDDFWTLADENLLPQETRNYVPTILAMTLIGRDPTRYGFEVRRATPLEVERVPVREATDLRVIADSLGLSLERLHALNPQLLRWATPPEDDEFELILPKGYRRLFEERVAPLDARDRLLFYYHVVARGETLSHLSQRYGVSVGTIVASNHLNSDGLIRVGQSLVIPLSDIPVPPSAMVASTEPQEPPHIYRVRRGDTLSGIAERFGLTVADIRSWNSMPSSFLLAGTTLRLAPKPDEGNPGPQAEKIVYSVRRGDTLTRIATSYQTSVEAIRSWNLGSDLSTIRPGDQITIYCTSGNIC